MYGFYYYELKMQNLVTAVTTAIQKPWDEQRLLISLKDF